MSDERVVTLADVPFAELDLGYRGTAGLSATLSYGVTDLGKCAVLAAEVHAELNGVPLAIERGGSAQDEGFPNCIEPHFALAAKPSASAYTLVIADSSTTWTIDLGDQPAGRELTSNPPGPFGGTLELAAGQTYDLRWSVPSDLETPFRVVLRGDGQDRSASPVKGPNGRITVTMPDAASTGDLVVFTGGEPELPISLSGVVVHLDHRSLQTRAPVHVTLP